MKSILSIDGGGIRGIIPLACLVRLESREGKPSHEIFDMIAGTSTGAIIAGGIALGISARGLLALYKYMARKAFTPLPLWRVILNGGNHRYSNTFISEILSDLGADQELNGLPIDLLITAKNTSTSRTDFFVRDAPGNACLWGTMSLKDAILASIAAPTYLPAHSAEVKGVRHTWVDGGVGVAGNPSYHAAVEAMHYSSGRYPTGETHMLSFGTGRSPHSIQAECANIVQWGSWVLSELLEDASDWQQYVTRTEYDMTGRIDLRRYQLDLAHDVMKILGVSVPDDVDVTNIGLDATWAIDLLESIGHAFADRIDFDHPDGLELKSTVST